MASSHPAWSHWSDATVLDDYAMTTTTTKEMGAIIIRCFCNIYLHFLQPIRIHRMQFQTNYKQFPPQYQLLHRPIITCSARWCSLAILECDRSALDWACQSNAASHRRRTTLCHHYFPSTPPTHALITTGNITLYAITKWGHIQ